MADNSFIPPDDLQQELMATRHLLGEFGIGSSDENGKVLDLLSELKEMTQKKDLELRRYFRKYFKKKIAPHQAEMGCRWLHCPESGQLWHLQRPRVPEPRQSRDRGTGRKSSAQLKPRVSCSTAKIEIGDSIIPRFLLQSHKALSVSLDGSVHIFSVFQGKGLGQSFRNLLMKYTYIQKRCRL